MSAKMERLDIASLFLLGLLGTGHCVGMCGPLVLALPSRFGRFTGHLLYHLGRISTYVMVGVVLGAIGSGLDDLSGQDGGDSLATVAQIQVVFSILAAAFMLIFGLARVGVIPEPSWMSKASLSKIPGFGTVQKNVLIEKRAGSIFWFGFLLGFLPCGLSYGAFAKSFAAGGTLKGGVATLAFGLGTVPGLLAIGTGAGGWMRRNQRLSDLLSGILMIGMALSTALKALEPLMT